MDSSFYEITKELDPKFATGRATNLELIRGAIHKANHLGLSGKRITRVELVEPTDSNPDFSLVFHLTKEPGES